VKPEEVVISVHHDSSHMNLSNILSELQIATDIEAPRWLITVSPNGDAEVEISPSVAYVADELRKQPVTDTASVMQWLRKYDVKASEAQLREIFGPSKLTATGKDDSVIKAFYAPLTVYLHHAGGTRTITTTGVHSVRSVLQMVPGRRWHLHGVQLLPFRDVPVWRCCTHSNTELHLYDKPHQGEYTVRNTLAGALRLPVGASGFVPYPTVSGSMFGDPGVLKVADVVRAAPATLHTCWIAQVNANDRDLCMDRAMVVVDALELRYGRSQCIAAVGSMLPAGQQACFEKVMSLPCRPHACVRRRYACYVQCIKDLLNGTLKARPLTLTYSGRTFPLSPLTTWKHLTSVLPAGWSASLVTPDTLVARMALERGDFIMEELRSDKIEIALVPTQKRKRN
jgi:hypothetical protein